MTSKNRENYRLKKLAKLVSDCDTVLDIGYADNPNPYFRNPVIIGADITTGQLPKNYHKTYQSDLNGIINQLGKEHVDAIVAGEIIEHLEDPMDFLHSSFQLLKPGGRIILSTPNPNSPIESLLTIWLSRRWFYTSDHIMLFPQRWLIRMLERAEFTDVGLYSGGSHIPFMGLVPFPRPWCYQAIACATKNR